MAALTAFHKLIAPEVAGCPQPVMNEAILRACIEFCERSRAVDESTTVVTAAGTAEYAMVFASGSTPHEVLSVRRTTGSKLRKTSRDVYDASFAPGSQDTPTHYYMNSDDELVLGPEPSGIETLTVSAVVKPAHDATDVHDALLFNWATAIAAGAKAKLYAQKGMAWYDPNEAALKERDFSEAIAAAVAQLNTGRTGGLLRVAMRPAA